MILDPDQIGLVLALSARIHLVVELEESPASDGLITVVSPQFSEAEWKYQCNVLPDSSIEIHDMYIILEFPD